MSRAAAQLLIVDDDTELCALLAEYLGAQGCEVHAVHDGDAALQAVDGREFDLVVLDVMLPVRDGFDVLRALRRKSRVPVLMLTARGEDVDRIVGLELGADDYLAKPFNPRELLARIRAILRRAEGAKEEAPPGGALRIDDLELDARGRTVRRNGELVELTGAEFALLEVLLRASGRVVSKDVLSEQAFSRVLGPYDRTVDVHVSHLRRKLGPLPDGRHRITTVRGKGYQYVADSVPAR